MSNKVKDKTPLTEKCWCTLTNEEWKKHVFIPKKWITANEQLGQLITPTHMQQNKHPNQINHHLFNERSNNIIRAQFNKNKPTHHNGTGNENCTQ